MKNTNSKPSSRLLEHCCYWDTFISKGTFLVLIFMLPLVGIAQTKPYTKEQKLAFYQAEQAEKTALENAKIQKAQEAMLLKKREALQAMGMSKSEIQDYLNPDTVIANRDTFEAAAVPTNDICSNAEALICDRPFTGSTLEASGTDTPVFCGTAPGSYGVWYTFTGDGNILTLSTCDAGTDYDTKINVYSGSCGSLSCVTGNDDDCGLQSTVTFEAESGLQYYIYVNGFGGSRGDFTLNVSCEAPAGNDFCAGALPATCNNSYSGSTATASPDAVSSCGTSLNTAPGVWYSFVGTGEYVIADTFGSSYDTKLGVFTGSCGDLICVDGNDDTGGLQSQVAFFGEEGTTYYILVTGFSSASGNFDLNIGCFSEPTNDLCSDAITIDCGSVVEGSTLLASADLAGIEDCDGEYTFDTTYESPGLWYKIRGTGGPIELSTCGSPLDTKIGVFTGNCNNNSLECYAGSDDGGNCGFQTEFEFETTNGEWYYIYMTAFGSDNTGDFTLTVRCPVEADIADDCIMAFNGYCPEISVDVSYGTPPYSYEWSNGSTSATITACVDENTEYSVTVTDALGETATDSTQVVYVPQDVSCQDDKVTICHINNNGTTEELCVAASSVQAHLAHGDTVGGCDANFYTCDTPPGCPTITAPLNAAREVSIPVSIEWTGALGLVDGYLINVGTTSGETDILNGLDVGMSTSYSLENLDFETTYYVSVIAYNSNGPAEGCGEISFTTEQQPCTDGDLNLEVVLDFWGSETTWEIVDSGNNQLYSGGPYSDFSPGTTYNYSVQLSNGNFTLKVYDSYGDGINYNGITLTEVSSGDEIAYIVGDFDYETSVDFCVEGSIFRLAAPEEASFGQLDWSMAPNPTKGNVTLDLSNYLESNVTIDVLNVTGKVIYNTSLQNLKGSKYQVELNSGLPAGMYFVRVAAQGQVSSKKLMIMH